MSVSGPQKPYKLWFKIARGAVGWALFVIGLFGVPTNIKRMSDFAEQIDSNVGRWILCAVGLLLVLWAHGVYEFIWQKIKGLRPPQTTPGQPATAHVKRPRKPAKSLAEKERIELLEALAEECPGRSFAADPAAYHNWCNRAEATIQKAVGESEAAEFVSARNQDVPGTETSVALAYLQGLINHLKNQP
jgi:hypothetical protein